MNTLSSDPVSTTQLSPPMTAYGTEASVLTHIYQPTHNMVVWQRSVSSTLKAGISTFFHQNSRFQYSHTLTPSKAESTLVKALADFPCAVELSQNIAELVDMFCCLFDLGQTGLRLAMLDKAMCPRFHVDHVPCRLVTTFVGVGSEWLEEPGLDRTRLGAGNNGLPDHASGLFPNTAHIQRAKEGDVLLLKGERWEGNEGFGIVHRSPNINANDKRLVLTLDFS